MNSDEVAQALEHDPLPRLITLAGHVVSQRFGRIFASEPGLSPAGAGVLAVLRWGIGRGLDRGTPGRATQAALARRMFMAPATVTGIVDTLEKNGFVQRERDERDRRVTWVVITESGRELMSRIGKRTVAVIRPTTVEQDPEKLAVIRAYLIELITANCDKEER